MDLSNLLTTEEAAQEMDWTPRYIARLIRDGRLKATKKAGRWLIQRSDLQNIAPAENPPGRPWHKERNSEAT